MIFLYISISAATYSILEKSSFVNTGRFSAITCGFILLFFIYRNNKTGIFFHNDCDLKNEFPKKVHLQFKPNDIIFKIDDYEPRDAQINFLYKCRGINVTQAETDSILTKKGYLTYMTHRNPIAMICFIDNKSISQLPTNFKKLQLQKNKYITFNIPIHYQQRTLYYNMFVLEKNIVVETKN
jgi:hypothetical protein